MMNIEEMINAGSSSYMAKIPPSSAIINFQTNIIAPPETIPARTPHLVVRFQKSENSIAGPNAAPKPAHAKDTILKKEDTVCMYYYLEVL